MRFLLTNSQLEPGPSAPQLGEKHSLAHGFSYTGITPPLHSEQSTLIFNGALFNATELAREINTSGLNDSGLTDTDLVLRLLESIGIDKTLQKIKGIFNFIWLNHTDGNVIAATDELADNFFLYSQNGDGLTIASDLNALSDAHFELNDKWVQNYFAGATSWSNDCALKNVHKVRPAHYLFFTGAKNQIEHREYVNLKHRTREASLAPRLSLTEVASRSLEILERDLRNLTRNGKRPGMLLSQGADSIVLMAVLKKIGVPCMSATRLNTRSSEEVLACHAWLRTTLATENNSVLHIDNETVLDSVDPSYYLEPGSFTWYTSVIEYPKQIIPMLQKGCDLVLLGHYGDHVYFHRARYAIAEFLYKNPTVFAQARELFARDQKAAASWCEDSFRAAHPSVEKSYSFTKSDFSRFDLEEVLRADSFPDYVLMSHRGLRGINDDRFHRLRSGVGVYSPYANMDHLYLSLRLSPDDLFLATTDLAVQKEMLRQLGIDARHLTKSGSDYSMVREDKVFASKKQLPWHDCIEELFRMKTPSAPYFQKMLLEEPRERFNARLIRMLTFFFWKKNRDGQSARSDRRALEKT